MVVNECEVAKEADAIELDSNATKSYASEKKCFGTLNDRVSVISNITVSTMMLGQRVEVGSFKDKVSLTFKHRSHTGLTTSVIQS